MQQDLTENILGNPQRNRRTNRLYKANNFITVAFSQKYLKSKSFELGLNGAELSYELLSVLLCVQISQAISNNVQAVDSKMPPEINKEIAAIRYPKINTC